jgi:hypothetical protein
MAGAVIEAYRPSVTVDNVREVTSADGCDHAFTFKNNTSHIIKVLLEEDPESELPEYFANAVGFFKNAMGIFNLGAKANVGRIRKGERPNQDLILYPGDETQKTMKSECILYSAAFVDGEVYKFFETQDTVNAGTVLTFSAKHERPEQIKAEVRATNIEQALKTYLSNKMSQQSAPEGLILANMQAPTKHKDSPLPPHAAPLAFVGAPPGFIPISGPVMVHSSQQGWVPADCKGLAIASEHYPAGSVLVVYRGQQNQKIVPPDQLASTLMPAAYPAAGAPAGADPGCIPISGPVKVYSTQQGWVLADCKGLAIGSQQHPSGSVVVVYRGQPNQKTLLPGQLASTLMPVV